MPALVKKTGRTYSVVEKGTGEVKKGGYKSSEQAQRYATALNLAHARKRGYKVPPRK